MSGNGKLPIADDRSRDTRAGFTLVEMIVTLSILAMVMTGFAMTVARRDNTPTPRDKAKEIQALVYFARSEAIGSGRDTTVVIDTKNRRFDYGDRSPVLLAEGQKLRIVTGRELVAADGKVSLVFLSDGGSSGADIELTDARARSATIRINWLTGLPALIEGTSNE